MALFYPVQKIMFQESVTILAINPGTKYVGIAIFQASDLVYWGIRVLKGKWSQEKMRNIETALQNHITRYHVNLLVLKKLHASRSSKNLNYLVKSIGRLAKKKEIELSFYSLNDVKKFLAVGIKANKMSIAGIVAARYPFLIHELEKEKKHKHPYFVRMFEAIAAGVVTFNRLDHK
jgi:Holliday junction resolvasome RuvABC endonuclease subunit